VTEDSAIIEVSRHDRVHQRVTTQMITLDGQGMHLRPVAIRYSWPTELDLMAARAGARVPAVYLAEVEADTGWFTLLMEDIAGAAQGDQIAACSPDVAAAVRLLAESHQFVRPEVVLPLDDAVITFEAESLRGAARGRGRRR